MNLETQIVIQEIHIISEQMKSNLEREIKKNIQEGQLEIAEELQKILDKLNKLGKQNL